MSVPIDPWATPAGALSVLPSPTLGGGGQQGNVPLEALPLGVLKWSLSFSDRGVQGGFVLEPGMRRQLHVGLCLATEGVVASALESRAWQHLPFVWELFLQHQARWRSYCHWHTGQWHEGK